MTLKETKQPLIEVKLKGSRAEACFPTYLSGNIIGGKSHMTALKMYIRKTIKQLFCFQYKNNDQSEKLGWWLKSFTYLRLQCSISVDNIRWLSFLLITVLYTVLQTQYRSSGLVSKLTRYRWSQLVYNHMNGTKAAKTKINFHETKSIVLLLKDIFFIFFPSNVKYQFKSFWLDQQRAL